MKKLKVYSLRNTPYKLISKKMFSLFLLFVSLFLGLFYSQNLFTDITNKIFSGKISQDQLYTESKLVPNSTGIIWPVGKVVDLSYKSLQKYNFTYQKVKQTNWDNIPEGLKRPFPLHINDYINKYKYITLKKAWNYFSNPEELNYFTFLRRVVRTIWTASYDFDKIWIRGSGTHAGVDIISAIGTPIYSISTGLVVEVKYSNKGFGHYLGVLYKVNGKYYEVFYGHLHKILVRVGEIVGKGQKIALMGNSGNSTAPHLHFQVNKVFVLQDIVSGKVMMGWYHTLAGVRAYTVDPILFVENNLDKTYYKNGDNLPNVVRQVSVPKKNVEKKTESDNLDLVAAIESHLSKSIKSKKNKISPAYIKNIKISLIDNKIQVGYGFTIKLTVATGVGEIAIKPSNSNLSYSPDLIKNPQKSQYIINVLALKPGQTTLTFSDGKSIKAYNITIYDKTDTKLFGLDTQTTRFNLLTGTLVKVFPIDKFGKKINLKLKGEYKIYFETGNKQVFVNTIQSNGNLSFYVKGKILGKSKLVVKGRNIILRKNVITNLAKDYPYTGEYVSDLNFLITKGIIKGQNGYLMPNSKLSRRALLIIIGRGFYKANYEKLKEQMLAYIKKHGRFFKDIDGKAYADPYIFLAWKKGIIKGQNGYSLANTYVTKGELLTILSRLFKVPVKQDPLNVWKDLKSSQLKAVADTAKKYALYPFKNFDYFDAGEQVSRLIAFETFYRYMIFKQPVEVHTSAVVPSSNPQAQLQQAMKDIFDF